MKRFITQWILPPALALMAASAAAEPVANRDDAVAIVRAAVQYLKKHGKEKGYAEISNPKGLFVRGELYVVAVTLDGTVLAHGANPRLIGKYIYAMRDVDGKLFVQEQAKLARDVGSGWVDYRGLNPVSQAMEDKTAYVERLDDMMVASGIYRK
ncbi:MAG: cache domain-containing protein [Pseudomonadota bacterium]